MTKPKQVATPDPTPNSTTIHDDEIRLLAYHLYVESGKLDGNDVENWLKAKEELENRDKQGAAA